MVVLKRVVITLAIVVMLIYTWRGIQILSGSAGIHGPYRFEQISFPIPNNQQEISFKIVIQVGNKKVHQYIVKHIDELKEQTSCMYGTVSLYEMTQNLSTFISEGALQSGISTTEVRTGFSVGFDRR